jgi:hypothetical protein
MHYNLKVIVITHLYVKPRKILSRYTLEGHGKDRLHNEIDNACVSLAKLRAIKLVVASPGPLRVGHPRGLAAGVSGGPTAALYHSRGAGARLGDQELRPAWPAQRRPRERALRRKAIGRFPYYYGLARLGSAPATSEMKRPIVLG